MLSGYGLWWFEDICDPLDFETLADVAASYPSPIAAGEALFSLPEARCWRGMAACVRIATCWCSIPRIATAPRPMFESSRNSWRAAGPRRRSGRMAGTCSPAHVAAGLGLGGAELNPFAFQPFCGQAEGGRIVDGMADLPQAPGIGFEAHAGVAALLRRVFPDLRLGS